MMAPRPICPSNVRSQRLHEIASIRTGFTPHPERRSRDLPALAWSGAGKGSDYIRRTVLMIHPSMVTDDGGLDWMRLERINVPPSQSIERHALVPGAVLLCLRGVLRAFHVTAAVLDESPDVPGERLPVVASSAWAVICPTGDALDSAFLAWHLVQTSTQGQLRSKRIGSSLPFVPLRQLDDLMIPLPPIREQQAISRAAKLMDQIDKLEQQRSALLREYLHGSLRPRLSDGHVAPNPKASRNR
jgi:hypothetical protein